MIERNVKIAVADDFEEIDFKMVRDAIGYLVTWSYEHYKRVVITVDKKGNIGAEYFVTPQSSKLAYYMFGERPRNLSDPHLKYTFNS